MVRPAARVLTLLGLLQSGGTRTVGELAERLGVDERTVRRYAQHLLDLDIPVESVRGRYGGLRLARGHRMPPLMLSDEEALEVVLGLRAARRAGSSTSSPTANETASAKVRRLLPERLVTQLDAVLGTVVATGGPSDRPAPDATVLLTVADAVRQHRPLTLRYGGGGWRTLHPYGLVTHEERWYLLGLDLGAGEQRTFRVDRIDEARVQAGTFRPPASFDPARELLARMAAAPYRYTVVVRVQGTEDDLRSRLPASVAAIGPVPDDAGWLRVEIHAERLDWVPGVLVALDRPFVVEGPDELAELVIAVAERLRRAVVSP